MAIKPTEGPRNKADGAKRAGEGAEAKGRSVSNDAKNAGTDANTAAPPVNSDPSAQLSTNQKAGVDQARTDAENSVNTNNQIAAIGMWASTQAALTKLKSDLNDAMNSFIKGVGSSVKSAAQ
jgi:hypothetical protein